MCGRLVERAQRCPQLVCQGEGRVECPGCGAGDAVRAAGAAAGRGAHVGGRAGGGAAAHGRAAGGGAGRARGPAARLPRARPALPLQLHPAPPGAPAGRGAPCPPHMAPGAPATGTSLRAPAPELCRNTCRRQCPAATPGAPAASVGLLAALCWHCGALLASLAGPSCGGPGPARWRPSTHHLAAARASAQRSLLHSHRARLRRPRCPVGAQLAGGSARGGCTHRAWG